MARLSRLQFVTDVSAADWVVAGVGPFGSGVGGLVPHGFEAYARILHPAWETGDRLVTWAEVAAWSGRTVHPRAQFEAIAKPAAGAGITARSWQNAPDPGTLPPTLLSALCDIRPPTPGLPITAGSASGTDSAGRGATTPWLPPPPRAVRRASQRNGEFSRRSSRRT